MCSFKCNKKILQPFELIQNHQHSMCANNKALTIYNSLEDIKNQYAHYDDKMIDDLCSCAAAIIEISSPKKTTMNTNFDKRRTKKITKTPTRKAVKRYTFFCCSKNI
jgi:hypothetical protein